MTVTTLAHFVNQLVPVADQSKGTDFFFPNATGWAVGPTQKSWRLQVDKTGLPNGVKYLTVAVEYQYAGGWQLDIGNAPDGWVGGVNHLDFGVTSFIDVLASEIGSVDAQGNPVGPRPTHARIHVLFSNGSTLPSILIEVADDFSLKDG